MSFSEYKWLQYRLRGIPKKDMVHMTRTIITELLRFNFNDFLEFVDFSSITKKDLKWLKEKVGATNYNLLL